MKLKVFNIEITNLISIIKKYTIVKLEFLSKLIIFQNRGAPNQDLQYKKYSLHQFIKYSHLHTIQEVTLDKEVFDLENLARNKIDFC